jgi:hypothetical protein
MGAMSLRRSLIFPSVGGFETSDPSIALGYLYRLILVNIPEDKIVFFKWIEAGRKAPSLSQSSYRFGGE